MQENIYHYFADFKKAAKEAQWPQARIEAVMEDARSSDYDHAVKVLTFAIHETYAS
jgi:hypothetical protein